MWEELRSIVGFCHVRCRDCGHRHRKALLWLDGLTHARCPKCYRSELTDWDEPYYFPPGYVRALLHIGGKAHRCRACRVNFVSFLGRKSTLRPSGSPGASGRAAA